MTPTLILTESALRYIDLLREKEAKPDLKLRVTVLGGGCAGFRYELGYEDTIQADDFLFQERIVTDATSMQFLENATIDYERTMVKQGFKIKIPKTGGCGCGKSFSVRES